MLKVVVVVMVVRWMKRKIIAEKKWCYQRGNLSNSHEFCHAGDNWMCSLNCHCCTQCICVWAKQIWLCKEMSVSQPHPMRERDIYIGFNWWHEINWMAWLWWNRTRKEGKMNQIWRFFIQFKRKKTYYKIFWPHFLITHCVCSILWSASVVVWEEEVAFSKKNFVYYVFASVWREQGKKSFDSIL